MLGWHVSIYRQTDGGASPATFESPEGTRLGVWQTDVDGLDWLLALVKAGKAIDLGGNGYPYRYTAPAEHLFPYFIQNRPRANEYWLLGAGDVVTDKYEGKTVIDSDAASECRPEEWLLVEVWDES
jgi:hypothetical protein